MKRDYEKEYREYHSKPEQIANRSLRNQARASVGLIGSAQEVDHIKPLSKGGTNAPSNLRVVSREVNRSKGAK